jgi:integrase
MTRVRVPGITVRYVATRAAAGKKAWGLFIDVRFEGKRYSPTKFFASEADLDQEYPAACEEVAKRRRNHEEDVRRREALELPSLPLAPKGTVLFETIALRWIEEWIKPMREGATERGYDGLLKNHLLPIMRTWPVTDDCFTLQRLKDVLRNQLFERKVSLVTRIACQRCLSALLGWAIAELPPKHLSRNPLREQAIYIRHESERKVRLDQQPNPMTRAQAEAFLAYILEHYPEVYAYFLWLIEAGSRLGEVSAVKWPNLDLDFGKAYIIDAFSSSQRWRERREERTRGELSNLPEVTSGEKGTKTHREDQYIDLSPRLVEALRKVRVANRKAWLARGRPGKEPLHVFLTSKGTPRRPDKIVYRAFREACNKKQLVGQTGRDFTIHCLRDTFATLAILAGRPIGWVSLMLGHAQESTTREHYIKWIRLTEENPLGRAKPEVAE